MKMGIKKLRLLRMILWSAIVLSLLGGCGGGSGGGGGGGGGGNTVVRTLDVALVDILKQKCGEQTLQLLVSVTDYTGAPVRGLSAGAFTISENNRTQPITGLTQFVNTPMSISLVLDYSDSLTAVDKAAMKQAAKDFLTSMHPDDEAQVVKFADTIHPFPAVGFTRDKSYLIGIIDDPIPDTGGTRLYRAIAAAIDQQVAESANAIRAVILFSDGQDEDWPQEYTLNSVIALARSASIPIYTLYYQGNQNADKRYDMRRLASETGGRYFEAAVSDDFQGLFEDIDDALSNRYIIEYSTSAGSNDAIEVEVEVEHNGIRGEDSRQATGC
jgi:VWFA-related protein